jgi:hypothetical protein
VKLTLKYYKFLKIKSYLKKDELLLFYNSFDFNSTTWFALEKLLKSFNIVDYKSHNKITKKVFKESTFKRFTEFFNSPTVIIAPKAFDSTMFITLETVLIFLGIKINKMFYLFNQIKVIRCLDYRFSVANFVKSLKQNIKFLTSFF